ncbi:MAG: hypothetical protein K0S28_410 [Paucimonas sp.]|nr:hypothetical protein [Paucimonas sp.]
MKIDTSSTNQPVPSVPTKRVETQTAQRAWVGNLRPDALDMPEPAPASFVVSLSNAVIAATQADPVATSPTTLQTIADASDTAQNNPKLMLLILMIEKLSGKPVRLASLDLDVTDGKPCLPDPSFCRISTLADTASAPHVGFGIETDVCGPQKIDVKA